jgi:hypothetical protein
MHPAVLDVLHADRETQTLTEDGRTDGAVLIGAPQGFEHRS